MAALESYSVKPSGQFPMTFRALDDYHLTLILNDVFTKGFWKNLDDNASVEIKTPDGDVVSPPVKEFRS